MSAETTYTISELAREFSVTPRTIRFYEDQGLITPARAGVNRVYSRRDRARLLLTLRGKRLGLSLAQIRELIDMYDGAHSTAAQTQSLLQILAERRAALQQQREDIEAVLVEIDRAERHYRDALARDMQGQGSA